MRKQELYDRDVTGLSWIKSQASNASGDCVEVAWMGDGVAMRDSNNPTGPALRFTADEWVPFISGANLGEFNF
jgi:hypothetical protein